MVQHRQWYKREREGVTFYSSHSLMYLDSSFMFVSEAMPLENVFIYWNCFLLPMFVLGK